MFRIRLWDVFCFRLKISLSKPPTVHFSSKYGNKTKPLKPNGHIKVADPLKFNSVLNGQSTDFGMCFDICVCVCKHVCDVFRVWKSVVVNIKITLRWSRSIAFLLEMMCEWRRGRNDSNGDFLIMLFIVYEIDIGKLSFNFLSNNRIIRLSRG